MTEQYVAGELSILLGRLESAMPDAVSAAEVGRLRRRVEAGERSTWAASVVKVLEVCDESCWQALAAGDTMAFENEARICAELYGLGLCTGLL